MPSDASQRDTGDKLERHLRALDAGDAALVADFSVPNDRPADIVARDVLDRSGWSGLARSQARASIPGWSWRRGPHLASGGLCFEHGLVKSADVPDAVTLVVDAHQLPRHVRDFGLELARVFEEIAK